MTESDLIGMGYVKTLHGWKKQPTARISQYQIHPEAVSDEAKLHGEILEHCRSKGWLCVHARMDLASTLPLGTPDFLIIADRGRVFIIEAKSKTGKLTREQQAWITVAQGLGHPVFVLRSMAEFLEAIA